MKRKWKDRVQHLSQEEEKGGGREGRGEKRGRERERRGGEAGEKERERET